jgi:acyl carrier protein
VIRPNADLNQINLQSELVRDLGIDSLSMLLLALAVEERFKMRFPEGAAAPTTVGDVCDAVIAATGN